MIFECNLNDLDVQKTFPKNTFLQEIITSWNKIQKHQPNSNILKEIVWNNSNIKCNGKILYYKEWHEKGIKSLENFFEPSMNKYFNFETFRNKYNIKKRDFLKYYNIIGNIPLSMKEAVQHENKTNDDNISLNKIAETNQTKILYKLQIRKSSTLTKAEKKWQHLINEELNWNSIYMKAFDVTSDTYLRSFQYKFITRIIPTNVFLYKCKIKPSNTLKCQSTYFGNLNSYIFYGMN